MKITLLIFTIHFILRFALIKNENFIIKILKENIIRKEHSKNLTEMFKGKFYY